jgi:hypothetical protein
LSEKQFEGTNTLAYLVQPSVMKETCFYGLDTRQKVRIIRKQKLQKTTNLKTVDFLPKKTLIGFLKATLPTLNT